MPGLEVTRATMLASCPEPGRLVFHVFDEQSLANLPNFQTSKHPSLPLWNGSLMPYLRLWLPLLLPDIDWVIYSDVDTIWNRDVCELWESVVREGENGETVRSSSSRPSHPLTSLPAIAWVRDMASMRFDANEWIAKVAAGEGIAFDWARYACSGICVMNLKKLRETNFTQRVFDLYAKYGVPKYPDQDVLNVLLNRDSVLLPSVWGAMGDPNNLPPADEKCVYHLTGAGRHFHDKTPPTYPPQYLLWWLVWEKVSKGESGEKVRASNLSNPSILIPAPYRILSMLWPLHGLARILPLRLRERIVRQWFFARVLVGAWRKLI